ncbi:MAG: MBOAT family O-acyltransferase [Deltaproteobacteria bacterium]
MLFNSLTFGVFFIIVYALYLLLDHRRQNRMLLIASCVFYGAWDWRFLFLMFTSITTDFLCGRAIGRTQDVGAKKRFVALGVCVNLGILGFFKYFNFFAQSLAFLLGRFGLSANPHLLNIILPVGISFYTFQSMSYLVDVYRKEVEPVRSYTDYALFVSFFPQLVAGPIMRSKTLLPQIQAPRTVTWEKAGEGGYLILLGLFQKVFIADNLGRIVDAAFGFPGPYNGVLVLSALYFFSLQIFCDFAGYSNIARGLGRCMGFDIMINFKEPYFATNPREFWRRWHISLSTWLRDYLYIPLGGNQKGGARTYLNLLVTMLLGGLWHGAQWTFVLWGAYHGALLAVHRFLSPLLARIPQARSRALSGIWYGARALFFFHLVCLGWLLFRAGSFAQAARMFQALFLNFVVPPLFDPKEIWMRLATYGGVLLVLQALQFKSASPEAAFKRLPCWARFILCYVLFYAIVIFGVAHARYFIYFQF